MGPPAAPKSPSSARWPHAVRSARSRRQAHARSFRDLAPEAPVGLRVLVRLDADLRLEHADHRHDQRYRRVRGGRAHQACRPCRRSRRSSGRRAATRPGRWSRASRTPSTCPGGSRSPPREKPAAARRRQRRQAPRHRDEPPHDGWSTHIDRHRFGPRTVAATARSTAAHRRPKGDADMATRSWGGGIGARHCQPGDRARGPRGPKW